MTILEGIVLAIIGLIFLEPVIHKLAKLIGAMTKTVAALAFCLVLFMSMSPKQFARCERFVASVPHVVRCAFNHEQDGVHHEDRVAAQRAPEKKRSIERRLVEAVFAKQ